MEQAGQPSGSRCWRTAAERKRKMHRRFCNNCDSDIVGDEYHYVMECKSVQMVNLRTQYIPAYYRSHPNMFKFNILMRSLSQDNALAIKVGNFLCKATKVIL